MAAFHGNSSRNDINDTPAAPVSVINGTADADTIRAGVGNDIVHGGVAEPAFMGPEDVAAEIAAMRAERRARNAP